MKLFKRLALLSLALAIVFSSVVSVGAKVNVLDSAEYNNPNQFGKNSMKLKVGSNKVILRDIGSLQACINLPVKKAGLYKFTISDISASDGVFSCLDINFIHVIDTVGHYLGFIKSNSKIPYTCSSSSKKYWKNQNIYKTARIFEGLPDDAKYSWEEYNVMNQATLDFLMAKGESVESDLRSGLLQLEKSYVEKDKCVCDGKKVFYFDVPKANMIDCFLIPIKVDSLYVQYEDKLMIGYDMPVMTGKGINPTISFKMDVKRIK